MAAPVIDQGQQARTIGKGRWWEEYDPAYGICREGQSQPFCSGSARITGHTRPYRVANQADAPPESPQAPPAAVVAVAVPVHSVHPSTIPYHLKSPLRLLPVLHDMPRNHNPGTLRNRNRITNKTRLKIIHGNVEADPFGLEEDEEKARVISTAGVDAEDANVSLSLAASLVVCPVFALCPTTPLIVTQPVGALSLAAGRGNILTHQC